MELVERYEHGGTDDEDDQHHPFEPVPLVERTRMYDDAGSQRGTDEGEEEEAVVMAASTTARRRKRLMLSDSQDDDLPPSTETATSRKRSKKVLSATIVRGGSESDGDQREIAAVATATTTTDTERGSQQRKGTSREQTSTTSRFDSNNIERESERRGWSLNDSSGEEYVPTDERESAADVVMAPNLTVSPHKQGYVLGDSSALEEEYPDSAGSSTVATASPQGKIIEQGTMTVMQKKRVARILRLPKGLHKEHILSRAVRSVRMKTTRISLWLVVRHVPTRITKNAFPCQPSRSLERTST